MSANQTFSTQILGQTEKALGAILDRQLAGTGLTEPQWVTLSLAVLTGRPVAADEFTSRTAGVLKVDQGAARVHVDALIEHGLAQVSENEFTLTEAGRDLHARVRGNIAGITERLWGDLAPADLATAGRVLGIVLDRANAELAVAA
jgi:DNA-binding MarR family transcriptional regulator